MEAHLPAAPARSRRRTPVLALLGGAVIVAVALIVGVTVIKGSASRNEQPRLKLVSGRTLIANKSVNGLLIDLKIPKGVRITASDITFTAEGRTIRPSSVSITPRTGTRMIRIVVDDIPKGATSITIDPGNRHRDRVRIPLRKLPKLKSDPTTRASEQALIDRFGPPLLFLLQSSGQDFVLTDAPSFSRPSPDFGSFALKGIGLSWTGTSTPVASATGQFEGKADLGRFTMKGSVRALRPGYCGGIFVYQLEELQAESDTTTYVCDGSVRASRAATYAFNWALDPQHGGNDPYFEDSWPDGFTCHEWADSPNGAVSRYSCWDALNTEDERFQGITVRALVEYTTKNVEGGVASSVNVTFEQLTCNVGEAPKGTCTPAEYSEVISSTDYTPKVRSHSTKVAMQPPGTPPCGATDASFATDQYWIEVEGVMKLRYRRAWCRESEDGWFLLAEHSDEDRPNSFTMVHSALELLDTLDIDLDPYPIATSGIDAFVWNDGAWKPVEGWKGPASALVAGARGLDNQLMTIEVDGDRLTQRRWTRDGDRVIAVGDPARGSRGDASFVTLATG